MSLSGMIFPRDKLAIRLTSKWKSGLVCALKKLSKATGVQAMPGAWDSAEWEGQQRRENDEVREGGEEGCSSTSSIDFQLAFEKKVVPFDLANSNFLGTIKCHVKTTILGFFAFSVVSNSSFFSIEKASCLINGFAFFGHALHIWLQFPSLKKRLLLLHFFFRSCYSWELWQAPL